MVLPPDTPVPNSILEACWLTLWLMEALTFVGITVLAFTPLTKPTVKDEIKTAPIIAEPKVAPTCLKVVLTPDAAPDSSTETADKAMLLDCDIISPAPAPNKAKPGASAQVPAVTETPERKA